ncbi:uncharacterized protein LOC123260814 isoform X2 [Cotesia glomerata]|uniref:uncharacterized protein LOC123260814 isoform X2 n=1 Tax=Cotesia glomerata TaxID=32391 RepID=UPI001D01A9E9|nr:uncharacterized protein LOC123260814 isoform X2 [Cotesia glomerata]
MKGGVIICAIIICELINGFTAAPFVFPGPSSDDYSDFGVPEGRELFGHRKHNFPRGHGCRGHGCLGIGPRPRPRPDHGGYYPNNNQAGTFATASAGSSGAGNTQANAQSASFNFGPFSASFSSAQASSGNQPQFSSFLNYDY